MREYIDKNLQPLPAQVTVDETLSHLLKNRWSETFLMNGDQELFLVKMADLVYEDPESPALPFAQAFNTRLHTDLHWSQWLHFFKTIGVDVLPAYHPNGDLAALVSMNQLLGALPDLQVMEQPGALIMLECNPSFYAASEIIRIAEMYNARVIALLTHSDPLTLKLVITLKLNIQECTGIASTYERFGYEILHIFMNSDPDTDVYTERYESLLRTFDIK